MDYTSLSTDYDRDHKPLAEASTLQTVPSRKPLPDDAKRRRSGARAARPPWSAWDLLGDATCLVVPLGLLGLLIAVLQLEGKKADDKAFSRWTNAISIVSLHLQQAFRGLLIVGHEAHTV